jgi:aminopeptidase
MPDPRVTKLANVLVNYSMEIKPGQELAIYTSPLADELTLAVYGAAVKAGAHVFVWSEVPGVTELLFEQASDEQLDHISPVRKLITETFDALLIIDAEWNTRRLSATDPARLARREEAYAPVSKTFSERAARRELRWAYTVVPTHSWAQEADMSLSDYTEFVYGAGMLNEPDPVAFWRGMEEQQQRLVAWLAGKDRLVLRGANVDLTMSVKDRPFISSSGRRNFPDGEIFAGPVENSANGWIRFSYPAIQGGREVAGIALWFEEGKVVKETASKGEDLLTALLNTDPGARHLGEVGIGTNYGIGRCTKNIAFDEKIGGTIHLAVGASYPESGKNESGVHMDMVCDMNDAEVTADGELFYKNGRFVV